MGRCGAWRSLRTLTRSRVTGRCWPTRRRRPACGPSSPAAPAGRGGTWSGIRPTSTTGPPGRGPADADLIAAYRDGHAALVATLRDADPDLECATFMPAPSPLAFWARRRAHEPPTPRYAAQSPLSGAPPAPAAAFDPAFAA